MAVSRVLRFAQALIPAKPLLPVFLSDQERPLMRHILPKQKRVAPHRRQSSGFPIEFLPLERLRPEFLQPEHRRSVLQSELQNRSGLVPLEFRFFAVSQVVQRLLVL